MELPCITEQAKIGMSENEFIIKFGQPRSVLENKEEILEDLTYLKKEYDDYINAYGSSSDGEIEKRLEYINGVLNDKSFDINVKKSTYVIKIPHDGSEYLKKVYFYNNRLILF